MSTRVEPAALIGFGSVAWSGAVLWFYLTHGHYGDLSPVVPIWILGIAIILSVGMSCRIEVVNPVSVFSAYYSLFCVSGLYYFHNGFGSSEFFDYLYSVEPVRLLSKTLWILVLGYAAFVLGFFSAVRKSIPNSMRFPGRYNNQFINLAAATFVAIGLLNFLYLAYSLAGGIPEYFLSVGQRDSQLETYGGSTLGYRFLEAGIFLLLFRDLRRGRVGTLVVILLLVGVATRISTGRITQTMVFAMVSVMLIYFRFGDRISAKQIVLSGLAICGAGIALYFARLLSRFQSSYLALADAWEAVKIFASVDVMAYFLIERGNLPNLPVLMKIVEVWSDDGSFLYGRSFLYPLLNLFPGDSQAIAIELKEKFFWDAVSGNLPPTGVGEMYANFGFLGVGIGMSLVGFGTAKLYNFVRAQGTYWHYLAYSFFLFGFLFTYPKGESANLGLVFIGVVPVLLSAGVIRLASRYLVGPFSIERVRKTDH